MEPIKAFEGPYRFLSNFYPSDVELDGDIYPTVEHAFQAAKTQNRAQRERVRLCSTPGLAKKAGRVVTLRPEWEEVKIAVMFFLLLRKFEPGSILAERLLATGDAYLEEGNWWGDRFWGVCDGEGSNWLGICLMGIRQSLVPCLQNQLLNLGFAVEEMTEAVRGGA